MVDRLERNKDLIQELVETTATHVGSIATIITTAVADIAREIGEIVTDGFEMREAAQRARVDAEGLIIDGDLDEPALEEAALEDSPAAEVESDDAATDEPEAALTRADEINIEGSIEAPVTPQPLDDPDFPDGDLPEGITVEAMMEAPVTPDDV